MALPELTLDKIRGLMMGLAVGDALGAVYDDPSSNFGAYSGYLQGSFERVIKNKGMYSVAAGTLTDVTDLAMQNARGLLQNRQFPWQRSATINRYMTWTNSSNSLFLPLDMVNNFKGIKTEKAYIDRYDKEEALGFDYNKWSITSTTLPRNVPLAIIKENTYPVEDAKLTHHHPLVYEITMLWVDALRLAMWDVDPKAIIDNMYTVSSDIMVRNTIEAGISGEEFSIDGPYKTDCYVSLYVLCRCIHADIQTLEAANDFIVTSFPGADMRYITSMVSAFYGASLGYDSINLEEKTSFNIQTVRNQGHQSSIHDFDDVCSKLHLYYA